MINTDQFTKEAIGVAFADALTSAIKEGIEMEILGEDQEFLLGDNILVAAAKVINDEVNKHRELTAALVLFDMTAKRILDEYLMFHINVVDGSLLLGPIMVVSDSAEDPVIKLAPIQMVEKSIHLAKEFMDEQIIPVVFGH